MKREPGVSVVICCYNSATRLPETLAHLARQQDVEGISWEVIVVDNASTDDTAKVARANWPSSAPAPLRVIHEPEPGQSNARLTGGRQALHEIISFIDDDNWVMPGWIRRVADIFAGHPDVGACGGGSIPVSDVPLPAWFESMRIYYAAGQQPHQTGDITDASGGLLWGAGLNVRKKAWFELLARGFEFLCVGRKGTQLSTGEDSELCYALRGIGWRFWYDEELVLSHYIPSSRLTWDYIRRLMGSNGPASALNDLYLIMLRKGSRYHDYPAWKQSWAFQMLKTVRQGCERFLRCPLSLTKKEGLIDGLYMQLILGKLKLLWAIRGDYSRLKQTIVQKYGTTSKARTGGEAPLPGLY